MQENEMGSQEPLGEVASTDHAVGDTTHVEVEHSAALDVPAPVENSQDSASVAESGKESDSDDEPDEMPAPQAHDLIEDLQAIVAADSEGVQEIVENYPMEFPSLYALRSTLEAALGSLDRIVAGSIPNTEKTRLWQQATQGGVENSIQFKAGALDAAATRESEWTQYPTYETRKLSPGRTSAKADGGYYRGAAAVAKVAGMTGLGQSVTYPLWSSGIWITVKAPSNTRLSELERKLVMNKDALGYSTSGMVFSNDSAYAMELLIDHILEDTADCTVEGWDPDLLKGLILSPDLQALALAYANSIYTNGFPYSVPCTIHPEHCTHVSVEKLHLGKLLKVDRRRLTDAQLKHMSTRSAKHSVEDIIKYQEQHTLSKVGSVQLTEGLSVRFAVPTLRDYIDTAHRWIDSIEQLTEKAFGRNLTGAQRQDYMRQQLLLAITRQYSHWVKEIVIVDMEADEPVERIIDDRNDIDNSIGGLTADDDLTDTLIGAIGTFISDRTIAMAAIHNFQCPNCGHWHHTTAPNKMLLPVDAVSTFFTLMQFKLLNFKPKI